MAPAQVDPSGDVLQLAYHRPLTRQAIQAVSNNRSLIDHEYLRTNSVLLLTSAPVWLGDKSSGGQLPSSNIGLTTAMTVSASGEQYYGAFQSAHFNSPTSDALRRGASLVFQPIPNPARRSLFAGVAQGESLYDQSNFQSNFRGEFIEPSLSADLGRLEQPPGWQIGGGGLFSYGCRSRASRFLVHCGPSFKQPREAFEGERCFGVLFRFEIGKRKPAH